MFIVNSTIKTIMKDINNLKQAQNIIHDFVFNRYDIFTGNEDDLFILMDSYANLSKVVSTLDKVFNTPCDEE